MKYYPQQTIEVSTLQKKTELLLAPTFKVPIVMDDLNNKLVHTDKTNGVKTNTQPLAELPLSVQQKTLRKKLNAQPVKTNTHSDRLRALAAKPIISKNDTEQNKVNEPVVAEVVVISTTSDSSHESSSTEKTEKKTQSRKRKKRSTSLGKTNGVDGEVSSLIGSNSNSQTHLNDSCKEIRNKNEKIIDNFFENCSKYVDDKLESLNKFFNANLISSSSSSGGKSSNLTTAPSVKSNLEKFNSLKTKSEVYRLHNNHLNKLNRLNDLIDLNSICQKTSNPKAKKIKHLDHQSTPISKSNNKNTNGEKKVNRSLGKASIEIDNINSEQKKAPFKTENTSNSSQIELLDTTNEESDTPSIRNITPRTTVNSNNLPLIPLLTIESEQREKGPAVILTWKILNLISNQILDDNDHEKYDILEYQLYGYREQSEHAKSNWNFVRKYISFCLILVIFDPYYRP
jgi:hypothetical protein